MTLIGPIPEGWTATPLGELCEIHGRIGFRGYTKADLVRKGEGAITFSPSDIHDQILSYKDCDYIRWAKYDESPEIQVRNGDILFCKTASIGKCALVLNLKEKATINPQFVLLNNFKCNGPLLYYMLAFSSFQNRVLVITGGSTIPTISQEAMKKQLIPIPDNPEEQSRVANTLLSIDKMISGLDEAIEKKRRIKEGLMQNLLTGRTRLPGFSGEWITFNLGDAGTWHKGQGLAKSDITQYGQNKCIHYGELFTSYGPVINKTISYTDSKLRVSSQCGDILFPASDVTPTGLGRSSCINIEGVLLGGDIIIWRPKSINNVSPDFISYCININKNQIIERVTGTTVKHVTSRALREISFHIPPAVNEQKAIASQLMNLDEEIAVIESKRDKYILVKQGMMQELLTGKTRLI